MYKRNLNIVYILILSLLIVSCGIYTFSGTSIQPDIKTVTINYVDYTALQVNPNLSNALTEALKDKFKKMTRLELVDMDGDLELTGVVTGYNVTAMAVTANETAAQSRLTVTMKLDFKNRKYKEDDFSRNFSAYADFDSSLPFDAKESELTDEIIEKIVDDIFNATVANW